MCSALRHPPKRHPSICSGALSYRLPPKSRFLYLISKASESLTGRGIRSLIDGKTVLVGNKRLMDESGVATDTLDFDAERLAGEGKTPMFVASGALY